MIIGRWSIVAPAGNATVVEAATNDTQVTAVRSSRLVSQNLAARSATVLVKEGTTPANETVVTFVNDDDEPHTVTATNKSFDSEGLDKNARWTHAFAKPGAFAYFCELHPMMKGRLIVKGAS